jgi:AraC family transcriptional regulator of arabinose operon
MFESDIIEISNGPAHNLISDDSVFFSVLPGRQEARLYRISREIWGKGHRISRRERDNYVLLYITEGQGRFLGEDGWGRFQKGQMLSLAPEFPHEVVCESQTARLRRVVAVGKECHELFSAHLGGFCKAWTLQQPLPIEDLIRTMFRKGQARHPLAEEICNAYYRVLLMMVQEDLASDPKYRPRAMSTYLAARTWLEQHFDQSVTIAEASEAIDISPEHLARLFQRFAEQSPTEFLRRLRLNKACHLLGNTALPVGEIARRVGYTDPFAFSRMFSRTLGRSPSAYRV